MIQHSEHFDLFWSVVFRSLTWSNNLKLLIYAGLHVVMKQTSCDQASPDVVSATLHVNFKVDNVTRRNIARSVSMDIPSNAPANRMIPNMSLRSQSTPSRLSAEDDFIFSRRSSEIRLQKYSNCEVLPPPGKFTKSFSSPCVVKSRPPLDALSAAQSSEAKFFPELNKSMQVCLIPGPRRQAQPLNLRPTAFCDGN